MTRAAKKEGGRGEWMAVIRVPSDIRVNYVEGKGARLSLFRGRFF